MMVLPNSWMAYNNEKSEKQNGGFGGIPILGNTQISNYIYIMYILYIYISCRQGIFTVFNGTIILR
jgi:hypothetical protein